jgi:hypothetical protein
VRLLESVYLVSHLVIYAGKIFLNRVQDQREFDWTRGVAILVDELLVAD